jgi:hypothetical protein
MKIVQRKCRLYRPIDRTGVVHLHDALCVKRVGHGGKRSARWVPMVFANEDAARNWARDRSLVVEDVDCC